MGGTEGQALLKPPHPIHHYAVGMTLGSTRSCRTVGGLQLGGLLYWCLRTADSAILRLRESAILQMAICQESLAVLVGAWLTYFSFPVCLIHS